MRADLRESGLDRDAPIVADIAWGEAKARRAFLL